MLRHARQGSVVRLKGGDPCIFGRAGEEAEWLARHGMDSEIVNGITAGLAGATACGIPLTYRGISRGVTLGDRGMTQDDSPLAWGSPGTQRYHAGGLHGRRPTRGDPAGLLAGWLRCRWR